MKFVEKQKQNTELVSELSQATNCDKYFAEMLIDRGCYERQAVDAFINPLFENLTNPCKYSGMTVAIERVKQAISNNEKIVIYGDYDCDGICAIAILYLSLIEHNANVVYYIPSRHKEGYGLNEEAIIKIAEEHFPDLLITVDCGISSHDVVDEILNLGIDVIITDHHEPPDILPNCILVNPKLDPTLFSEYCGAGVAFQIVNAMWGEDYAIKFLDIVAIATIGDLVPLVDDNRILVSLGLKKIHSNTLPGIKQLIATFKLNNPITAQDIAYKIVPRINSFGRLGDASRGILLFTSVDYFTLDCLITEMNSENSLRQLECEKVINSSLQMLKGIDLSNKYAIVLKSKDWNEGVIGIAASKIAELFKRPTILFYENEGMLKGSARSIEGIDLYTMLKNFSNIFESFGGHKQAAGLKMRECNLEIFKNNINDYLATYNQSCFKNTCNYDFDFTNIDVNIAFIEKIKSLEPFGIGNQRPVFLINENSSHFEAINNKNIHYKCKTNLGYPILAFNSKEIVPLLNSNIKKSMTITFGINNYNNKEYPQAIMSAVYANNPLTNLDEFECFLNYISLFSSTSLTDSSVLAKKKPIDIKHCDFKDSMEIKHCDIKDSMESLKKVRYGSLYIAFSLDSYKKFAETINNSVSELYDLQECFGILQGKNPYNAILVAPNIDIDYSYYRNIFLLDNAPLEVINKIYDSFNGNVYMCGNTQPFCSILEALIANRDIFADYFRQIKLFLSNNKVYNFRNALTDLITNNKINDRYQFVFCYYVFLELGLIISDEQGRLNINNIKTTLFDSKLYKFVEGKQWIIC